MSPRVSKPQLIEEERPGVGRRRHIEKVARRPRIQILQVSRLQQVREHRVSGRSVRARDHGEAQFVVPPR